MSFLVKKRNKEDLPTFGKPTRPILIGIYRKLFNGKWYLEGQLEEKWEIGGDSIFVKNIEKEKKNEPSVIFA